VTPLKSVLNGALPRRTSLPSKDTLLSWSPTTWIIASKATKGKIFTVEIFEFVLITFFCSVGLVESAYKYQLLGLNLLYLLSQNRVSEFHTELELLPPDQIHNAYIKHPLSIEQYLMEGRYNRVNYFLKHSEYANATLYFLNCEITLFWCSQIFLARDNVPHPDYSFFMEILLSTVRNEIAVCMEKAYERITLTEVAKMLYLPSVDDAKTFGRQVICSPL
jgi:CSN8/PSMD8/EIF3K family